ncbi:DUF998 domain-containing protein [Spirillospora sp. NPDC029432]|uniref:DUF998 domain-containing protein n=1 Tax=Spirillospora sp. NPDC029432 TaxID=3154599 RepID=UPI003454629A
MRSLQVSLLCGAVAGPLFTLAYLAEGATRTGYDPTRHPVSSLALGEHGWTQTANFLVAGSLTLAFAAGMWRAPRPAGGPLFGPLLIGVWGAGLIGAGLFRSDPVSGYPPGTPDRLQYTTLGILHDAFSLAGFAALIVACFVFTRRFLRAGSRTRAALSAAAGVLFVVLLQLSGSAFSQNADLVDHGGLLQRAAVTVGLGWMTWIALHLLRETRVDRP